MIPRAAQAAWRRTGSTRAARARRRAMTVSATT
jgi:hypothetical protein